jgi:RND family efflux transporter MFP subunit
MKKSNKPIAVLFALIAVVSCGPKNESELSKKQSELAAKEKEMAKLRTEINKLQDEIEKLDTTPKDNAIGVRVLEILTDAFENSFEMQAMVESDKNVLITPEIPGRVIRILVKEGQKVTTGQALVILDGSVAQAQIAELENTMILAKENYDRIKILWDQKIGSEMQYLQAKNQYENLQKSLNTAKTQLGKYTLRSPISGQVDEIKVNVGELAGTMTGGAVMRVVNTNDLKLKANVSERYTTALKQGQKVNVFYPSLNKTVAEKITAVGNVIDINNRTFSVYVSANALKNQLKPNMLAIVSATDFVEEKVISIPTKLLLNDGTKDYVYALKKQGNKYIAYRAYVEVNRKFASHSLIASGLETGTLIVSEGYGGIVEGDEVKIITQ